jgi:cell wall assembly regulator SMI1
MSRRAPRVFGTTEVCITQSEAALGRRFPPSFRAWLLSHNGKGLGRVSIFPVPDERNPQTLLDSSERQVREGWSTWLANFEGEGRTFDHLLPFAEFGTGDYYCFDYSKDAPGGEAPVVLWSHETGETELRASSFGEFAEKVIAGRFEMD